MPNTPDAGEENNLPAPRKDNPARKIGPVVKAVTRTPAFEIRFEGGEIWPEKIFVPDLAQVIRAAQRLSSGRLADETSPLAETEKLRLVGIRRGSARYAVAGPSRVVAETHLRVLGEIIERPDRLGKNDYILEPVGVLSRTAEKLGCRISIREPTPNGMVLASIGPMTYENLKKSVLITGQTEFGGRVERVGGATRSRCGLRVAFQKRMLICTVPNSSVARTLGENLYQRVVASGEAHWFRTTWRVFSFRIDTVRPLKKGSILDKIQAIRNLGGNDWDEVADVRSFLDGEDQTPEKVVLPLDQGGRTIEREVDDGDKEGER